MCCVEKKLKQAGAILVYCNKHKVYDLAGRRFVLHHSKKKSEIDLRQIQRFIRELQGK